MKYSKPYTYAIIAAAGSGSRANFNNNKLLEKLNGEYVIVKTVKAFLIDQIDKIVVTVSRSDYDVMQSIILPLSYKITLVVGGQTRTQSVKNALSLLDGGIVLIHDGARPFVTKQIILEAIENVIKHRSAIAAAPVVDTCANVCQNGFITSYNDRAHTYNIQTPQAFYTCDIKLAYENALETFTDDSAVYAAYFGGAKIFITHTNNNKLTFKKDFETSMNIHTGIGFDTHRLVKDKKLILGGVEIESELGLLGHSDADALTHAVMDALLSSAGLKDIGCHFPDTDERYKDVSSIELLKEVVAKLDQIGMRVKNVSAVIVTQQPKISPYIDKMRENLAKVMHISPNSVGITASTAEQMGAIGRCEGLAVTASCLTYYSKED